jgi:hypothetical protein
MADQLKTLKLCIGNLLIEIAKKIFPKEENEASTHRLQQLAAQISDKQLDKAGVPTKYWKSLRNISKVFGGFYHS